jgi:polyribonucleotide 5'-hydroxyl-kinase
MVEQSNLHWALEEVRQSAEEVGKDGPRLLIVGPENAGKTSLAKILTGYATRMERQPLVVNLDPKEGLLSLPGSLTAAPFRSIIDIEIGWGSSPTSGPSPVPVKLPLVYFYGLENPEEDDGKVFRPIVSRMAIAVTGRLQEDEETKVSGLIIDTPGSISAGKGGYEIISHIVSEFSVNIVVVLGSERLYSDMSKHFQGKPTNNNNNPGETVAVLKISKSGGCVDRDPAYMRQGRQAQIREYFFGDALNKTVLSPHTQTIDFDAISIYKTVAGARDAENAMLDALAPGGDVDEEEAAAQVAASEKQIFEKVQPTLAMQGCILGIMHADADEAEQESVRDASVMGFVYVVEVDEKRKKVRVLAPVGGRSMSGRAVVWGRWPEEVVDLVG